jgi:c-di-GMP-binding flagellar brake protein YcgR
LDNRELDLLRLSLFDTRPFIRGREVRLAVLAGAQGGEYDVRVEGADSENLYVTWPDREGAAAKLVPGTPVSVTVRSHDGTYQFSSRLADLAANGPGSLAIILPAEAQRLQRRRHLRSSVELPISVGRLPAKGEPLAALRLVAGRTGNLSEGGLWFTSPLKLKQGDLVSLSLQLPACRRRLLATCEVLRVDPEAGAAAAKFVDLDERMAAELTAFLERRRRERRLRSRAAANTGPTDPLLGGGQDA